MNLHVEYKQDPRNYALGLVENELTDANHLLLACLKYMTYDECRDMLKTNGLLPDDVESMLYRGRSD